MVYKDDNSSKKRYENVNGSNYVLDTWSGKMFRVPTSQRRTELAKGLMPPYYDVLGVVHPNDYNLKTVAPELTLQQLEWISNQRIEDQKNKD